MSIVFGGMRQLAFVIRNLQTSLKYWTEILGIGPFHVLNDVAVGDYLYRGAAARSRAMAGGAAMVHKGSLGSPSLGTTARFTIHLFRYQRDPGMVFSSRSPKA